MSKLNKSQIYAIQWLDGQKHSATEIANELNISEKSVVAVLEKNQKINDEADIKTASEAAGQVRSKNLMINKTSVKKTNNVMIMTPEASMQNDEAKKKLNNKSKTNSAIFRPNSK